MYHTMRAAGHSPSPELFQQLLAATAEATIRRSEGKEVRAPALRWGLCRLI